MMKTYQVLRAIKIDGSNYQVDGIVQLDDARGDWWVIAGDLSLIEDDISPADQSDLLSLTAQKLKSMERLARDIANIQGALA